MQILPTLYHHRWSILALVKREIETRYAGSYLGLAWLALYPMIFLSIYSFVYMHIFTLQSNVISQNDYILLIYCGLIPFLAIAETMSNATPAVVSNKDI